MIKQLNSSPKREPLSRLWFLARGCKQVPLDLTGGKVLWAHPDGYFLSAYGQKVLHTYSPSQRTPGMQCHNGKRGNVYPKMRHFGAKTCHSLMCITFHGPRPLGYECDHINGVVTDYRASNLQWVTPAENRRRSRILRIIRSIGRNPAEMSTEELLRIFASYDITDPLTYAAEEPGRDFDIFVERD